MKRKNVGPKSRFQIRYEVKNLCLIIS
jgi:hypothetical protein